MKFNVIVKMDPEKILEARGLGPDHRAAVAIASTVRRFCDPYVPMQQGILKNTATVGPSAEGAYILYGMPYAHYQYTGIVYGPNVLTKDGWRSMAPKGGKRPTDRALTYNQAPMRGKEWDKRMMADRKDDLLKAISVIIGGEVV